MASEQVIGGKRVIEEGSVEIEEIESQRGCAACHIILVAQPLPQHVLLIGYHHPSIPQAQVPSPLVGEGQGEGAVGRTGAVTLSTYPSLQVWNAYHKIAETALFYYVRRGEENMERQWLASKT